MNPIDLDLVHIDREMCAGRGGFAYFVRRSWPHLEPGVHLQWNWHIDLVCKVMEALYRFELQDVVINQPPGTMKTVLTHILGPAWLWTWAPERRQLSGSFSGTNARDAALKAQDLMVTDWYQQRWGEVWRPDPKTWQATYYRNSAKGFRMGVTVGGQGTGHHGHHISADASIKPMEAGEAKIDSAGLAGAIDWWDKTMGSRDLTEQTTRLINMQRLHPRDLTGHVVARELGYEHVCLPMHFDPARKCFIESLGIGDERTRPGELLWAERFPESRVEKRAARLGKLGTAAQEEQSPTTLEGGIIEKTWWRTYMVVPPRFDRMATAWDFNMGKETVSGSFVAGLVGGTVGPKLYVLDLFHERCGHRDAVTGLKAILEKWPQIGAIDIEDAAAGVSAIDSLKDEVGGVTPVPAKGSKESRLNAVSHFFQAGNIYIPDLLLAKFGETIKEEVTGFPNFGPDDIVDALVMLVRRLCRHADETVPGTGFDLDFKGMEKEATFGL